MIPQRNLSLLANRLAAGSGTRRVPEAVLERDYCLAWFLVALGESPLGRRLAFKGGTALKRCYFEDYRFSEDLDFTLTEPAALEWIREALPGVFQEIRRRSGIQFDYRREDRPAHQNSYTFYLGYEGPLPAGGGRPEVKTDITIRERIVFLPLERPVLRGYEEFTDLPDHATVQTYSLEEIAVEKVAAVTDPARNEPRDLYDLWYLLANGHVDLAEVTAALRAKLAFRDRQVAGLASKLTAKEERLRRLWVNRLAPQMLRLPEFDGVFREVRRRFRQAGL